MSRSSQKNAPPARARSMFGRDHDDPNDQPGEPQQGHRIFGNPLNILDEFMTAAGGFGPGDGLAPPLLVSPFPFEAFPLQPLQSLDALDRGRLPRCLPLPGTALTPDKFRDEVTVRRGSLTSAAATGPGSWTASRSAPSARRPRASPPPWGPS